LSYFFVDTSALSKRYVVEPGSTWVRNWTRPDTGNVIIISALTPVEGFAVFAWYRRERKITPTRHARLQAVFLAHIEREYLVINIDDAILEQARVLIDSYPLRALDAIQLASAQRAVILLGQSIIFITGDKILLNAAVGEGFSVDDPNTHP
jgi:uncharacterized protein